MKLTAGPYRTHDLSSLRAGDAGAGVVLSGWVRTVRDHGGVIFCDLRDRGGLTQVVFDPEIDAAAHAIAETIRPEFVIRVEGKVRPRPDDMINDKLATGAIEVEVTAVEVLSQAKTPPFPIEDDVEAGEALRLSHRYLDLRRPRLQRVLALRHRVVTEIRRRLDDWGFLEVETPVLTRSTPEGARDYLVPSRVHPGSFFALPQSPQLFKQVLMVAGVDRYYQIARCFRDEDLRADRQPEFTQVDLEMSFVDREGVIEVIEDVVAAVVEQARGVKVERPFARLPYAEAMSRFGSDKPDTRFGLELVDVTDPCGRSDMRVFTQIVQSGGKIVALRIPGGASFTRGEIDALTNKAVEFGAKGMAWVKRTDTWTGTIAKFFPDPIRAEMEEALGLVEGDLAVFSAGPRALALDVAGRLRLHLGEKLGLIDPDTLALCWVVDFPLLEHDPEAGRWIAMHHPFTAPLAADVDSLEDDPGSVRSDSYDLVLNGSEIGGGSVRIHQREMQERIFAFLGIDQEEARGKFGFLLDAFEYGAPPHAGIALGLDRIVMLLAGADSIRDTIAFPKTQKASCLLTSAPSPVSSAQLRELGVRLASGVGTGEPT